MAKKAKKPKGKKKAQESESEVDESDVSDLEGGGGGGGGGGADAELARLAAKGVKGLNADGTQTTAAAHRSWQFTAIEANREGDVEKMIGAYKSTEKPKETINLLTQKGGYGGFRWVGVWVGCGPERGATEDRFRWKVYVFGWRRRRGAGGRNVRRTQDKRNAQTPHIHPRTRAAAGI